MTSPAMKWSEGSLAEILLTTEQIQNRIREMGAEITRDYAGKKPLFIAILKGASMFHADLIRHVHLPVAVDFIAVASYGNETESSGQVQLIKDVETSIEGKDVIVVEDIVDTGLTLTYLLHNFQSRNPQSLKVATLLNKPSRRKVPVTPDYVGFEIPDKFVVGYGLDYAQNYRNLPYVAVLKSGGPDNF
ncbi:MAG TPA: hypoxanthine phosphoribosyltransferase [Acidobacteriota bacterium]|jgi:hypoxanthine phosphoribosyltransferase|nr:hypoxanthine phosphoribosyltransferase [Acidobacteriota bacterium]